MAYAGAAEAEKMSERRYFVLAHPQARANAVRAVALADEGWRVTIEPPKRSGEQNAALHALITQIATHCEWAGKRWDLETWKRLLVSAWGRTNGQQMQIVPALDGHGVDIVPIRTSKLTRAECSDLLEYVQAWAAENMQDRPA